MPYSVFLYNGAKVEETMSFMDFEKAFSQVKAYFMLKADFSYKHTCEILEESMLMAEEHCSKSFVDKEFRAWEVEDDVSKDIIFCTIKYTK
jgi:hypothetical protein